MNFLQVGHDGPILIVRWNLHSIRNYNFFIKVESTLQCQKLPQVIRFCCDSSLRQKLYAKKVSKGDLIVVHSAQCTPITQKKTVADPFLLGRGHGKEKEKQ